MEPNCKLLKKIYEGFEEIFEYNDYTWDDIEFRIAYQLQKSLMTLICDNELYISDKKYLANIQGYFTYYSINDNIRNILPILNGIIRFDYKKMKQENENLYLELNKVILKPERIQIMATNYGIDFFDYLDAIM
jgi:hypothetical protein